MKATVCIPEKDISFDLDEIMYSQFRMVHSKPSEENPLLIENVPFGKSITLITSNMPKELVTKISEMISQYCNH